MGGWHLKLGLGCEVFDPAGVLFFFLRIHAAHHLSFSNSFPIWKSSF